MYYPYLRGKQFELILLREMAEFISENAINPIIEPVKEDFSGIKKTIESLNNVNASFTLILNPQAGSTPVTKESLLQLMQDSDYHSNENFTIGYIIDSETELENLLLDLNELPEYSFSIIHKGFTSGKNLANAIKNIDQIQSHIFLDGYAGKLYQRYFKRDGLRKILVRDGFKPRERNALYPRNEHFSDLHITYPDEGMDGFGDFLIVGDDYSETGGPAYTIAIHLTYLNDEEDMYIYHFISDKTDSPTDPGGKFLEALNKLVKATQRPRSNILETTACSEYLELHEKQHYPGLGYVKKLSMKHHIELIADYLRNAE